MPAPKKLHLTPMQQEVRELSDRIVEAQRPIRVLDAVRFGNEEIKKKFFEQKGKELPDIPKNYYESRPLSFDSKEKKRELYGIERDIRKKLGQFTGVGNIMERMCREYREVVRMLNARGTDEFSFISQELYGSSQDAFYAGAPTLQDLGKLLANTLPELKKNLSHSDEVKIYTGEDAVSILSKELNAYFGENEEQTRVKVSDNIIADASAGAECIKLRQDAMFSKRDLRVLEVHEGWVHLGTTLNGMAQPICTFLSKGPPSSTITQEGLAIITEIFTFSSFPDRVHRLINRVNAIAMAENGADFLDIYHFFEEQGLDGNAAYSAASRVFRGSLPDGLPFTKDLVYSKGFILIYNYIRLAVQRGLLSMIPLLFVGKTTLEDLHILEDLVNEGLVTLPVYLPPPFRDLSGLSAWMCYSLFLNKLDLGQLALSYQNLF
ncbi:MAG: flavohemoglobin expression-modulating QEGLA motif protein [Legionellales bacterium]|nr:flavohemoglobin expression-modulating QEGLA motif protein [Legionellales bacterium]